MPFLLLDTLNELHEEPGCNKEHDRNSDKQYVHGFPSFAWININTSGIKLLLGMPANELKFHKDTFVQNNEKGVNDDGRFVRLRGIGSMKTTIPPQKKPEPQ